MLRHAGLLTQVKAGEEAGRLRAGAAVPPAHPGGAAAVAGGADPGGRAGHTRWPRPYELADRPVARPDHVHMANDRGPESHAGKSWESASRDQGGAASETYEAAPGRGGAVNGRAHGGHRCRRWRTSSGDRVLIAVQAVNISRLSTHPVPTVPGTLIVVAGAGPKDSNGAGKSSFIASITALLGDEQWRFASGAKAVSELLFNAELASGAGARQWASADHGYIVGVFSAGRGMDGPSPRPADPVVGGSRGLQRRRGRSSGPAGVLPGSRGRIRRAASCSPCPTRPAGPSPCGCGSTRRPRTWRSAGARACTWPPPPPRPSGWRGPTRCGRRCRSSAGRRDVVARDLTKVLYGDRVRCVSFLSTSVRSKVATNLLSQPLNEISPERVFEAIAALTGLDAELEQEREARRDEHAKRVRAAQAGDRLAEFEAESKALLTTFDRRDQARVRLADALRCWRGRQARRLADAAGKDEALAAELARHQAASEAAAEAIAMVKAEIAHAQGRHARPEGRGGAQGARRDRRRGPPSSTPTAPWRRTPPTSCAAVIPALEEARRFADGRDVPTAERELARGEAAAQRGAQGAGRGRPRGGLGRRRRWTTPKAVRPPPSSTRWRRPASARPACSTRSTWPSRPATTHRGRIRRGAGRPGILGWTTCGVAPGARGDRRRRRSSRPPPRRWPGCPDRCWSARPG